MTPKKRDIVLKNRPLDGWMDGFLTGPEWYMLKMTHWMIGRTILRFKSFGFDNLRVQLNAKSGCRSLVGDGHIFCQILGHPTLTVVVECLNTRFCGLVLRECHVWALVLTGHVRNSILSIILHPVLSYIILYGHVQLCTVLCSHA